MRFSIFATLLVATSAIASPTGGLLGGLLGGGAKSNKVSAADATALITSLNGVLTTHAQNVNATLQGLTAASPQAAKDAAVPKVGAEFKAMTSAITSTLGQLRQKAGAAKVARQTGSVQGLANAIRDLIIIVTAAVDVALAVLGVAPLFFFTIPLTTSLAQIVVYTQAVVDNLIPVLNTLLDGVLSGVADSLGGLIL